MSSEKAMCNGSWCHFLGQTYSHTQGPRVFITSSWTFTRVNGNDIPLHKSYEQDKKKKKSRDQMWSLVTEISNEKWEFVSNVNMEISRSN